MTNEESTELSEIGICSFDDPSSFESPHFAPVLKTPLDPIEAGGYYRFDATLLEPLSLRIGVVGTVGDHFLGLRTRSASGSRDVDFCECVFLKHNFYRCITFQPNSQQKTPPLYQYHPLHSLAALGFTYCRAPFFGGAKQPSKKILSHFRRPLVSSDPSRERHASSQTPCSTRCFSRIRKVVDEGYRSVKNLRAAPVWSNPRIPSRQSRFAAQGCPRLSLRSFGLGNRGVTIRHGAPASNLNRFLLMQQTDQIACLRLKSLA